MKACEHCGVRHGMAKEYDEKLQRCIIVVMR